MGQMPKISVVVPVYNVEHYVEKCIDSILRQTYRNLEIFLVDDGSTDGSRKKCEQYLSIDDRIQLICQTNQGLSAARNAAIDKATGDYIGFVDSDDWIASDLFEVLYRNAEEYHADISECAAKIVSETENVIPNDEEEEASLVVLEGIEKLLDNMHRSNHSMWGKLFRASLFEGIRMPEGRIYEDLATTYRLIDRANKIVVSPREKYYYVSRSSSITRQKFNIHHMDVLWASEQRYHYIVEKYPELEKECRNYILANVIWAVNKAYMDGYLEDRIHIEELQEIIDSLRVYDYRDCGLTKEQETALRFIFRSLKSYAATVKMFRR